MLTYLEEVARDTKGVERGREEKGWGTAGGIQGREGFLLEIRGSCPALKREPGGPKGQQLRKVSQVPNSIGGWESVCLRRCIQVAYIFSF